MRSTTWSVYDMKIATKGLICVALLAAVPAGAAAVCEGNKPVALERVLVREAIASESVRVKDPERNAGEASREPLAKAAPVRLAQARFPSGEGMLPRPPERPFPPSPGPLPVMHGPMHGMPPAPGPAMCHEDISRHAAMAGYLKSKLRLQRNQWDAWQKLEQAADGAVEELRAVCDQVVADTANPPDAMKAFDLAERRLTAQSAFLRAIREPLRAFYDTLSAEQKSILQPPPMLAP
jgi:hypothetical protein